MSNMHLLPAPGGFSRSLSFQTGLWGLGALFFVWGLLTILSYGLSNDPNALSYALVVCVMGALALIGAGTGSANRFLFSGAFWVTVVFVFYIILRSLYLIGGEDALALNKALLVSFIFLIGYWGGQSLSSVPLVDARPAPVLASGDRKRLYWLLLVSFVGFKALGGLLFLALGEGKSALEIAQSTQNQGAAYLFKIPTLSQAAYFILLLFAYKYRVFQKTAAVLTLVVLIEAIATAGRYALITTLVINLFLYHIYIKPIRAGILVVVAPLFIFIISFFGYIRNIELANAEVYSEAWRVFMEQPDLILMLFLSRLDMLPHMIEAFRLDVDGQIQHLSGMSYLYAFMHAIPRNFWPDKPPLTAAYVTEQTNPFVFGDGVNIFPSIMLEAYMNFSWFGPLLIGFVIARMVSTYERALYRGSVIKQAFALMIFTFPMGLINEGIHSNIFATILYLLAIYLCWAALLKIILGRRASGVLSQSNNREPKRHIRAT